MKYMQDLFVSVHNKKFNKQYNEGEIENLP